MARIPGRAWAVRQIAVRQFYVDASFVLGSDIRRMLPSVSPRAVFVHWRISISRVVLSACQTTSSLISLRQVPIVSTILENPPLPLELCLVSKI